MTPAEAAAGDRAAAAVTVARDTAGLLGDAASLVDAVTEWADDQLAGGAPPKHVAHKMIGAFRLITSAMRDEAVSP